MHDLKVSFEDDMMNPLLIDINQVVLTLQGKFKEKLEFIYLFSHLADTFIQSDLQTL